MHHNAGELPANMNLKLIEPLCELFKDKVQELGVALGLMRRVYGTTPFQALDWPFAFWEKSPPNASSFFQEANAIVIEELFKSGHYRAIGQAFVVLLPVKSVGVMGDGRTYDNVAAAPCVETMDYISQFLHLPYEVS